MGGKRKVKHKQILYINKPSNIATELLYAYPRIKAKYLETENQIGICSACPFVHIFYCSLTILSETPLSLGIQMQMSLSQFYRVKLEEYGMSCKEQISIFFSCLRILNFILRRQ